MSETSTTHGQVFYRFGLLVTGKGEEEFLPKFLRALTDYQGLHIPSHQENPSALTDDFEEKETPDGRHR